MKRLTQEEFIKRSHAVHGDRYDYSKVEYKNNSIKVCIICPDHGEFWQTPNKHMQGRGCPHPDCICKKKKDVWMEHYGTDNPAKVPEIYEKVKQTNLERYGVDNPAKNKQVKEKTKQTSRERYGVDCNLQLDSMKRKSAETKKKKGTYIVSKYEEKVYDMLCQHFGKDQVVWQYFSDEYPFSCDFHISSRDLYIEVNISWTHGFHWYGQLPRPSADALEVGACNCPVV